MDSFAKNEWDVVTSRQRKLREEAFASRLGELQDGGLSGHSIVPKELAIAGFKNLQETVHEWKRIILESWERIEPRQIHKARQEDEQNIRSFMDQEKIAIENEVDNIILGRFINLKDNLKHAREYLEQEHSILVANSVSHLESVNVSRQHRINIEKNERSHRFWTYALSIAGVVAALVGSIVTWQLSKDDVGKVRNMAKELEINVDSINQRIIKLEAVSSRPRANSRSNQSSQPTRAPRGG